MLLRGCIRRRRVESENEGKIYPSGVVLGRLLSLLAGELEECEKFGHDCSQRTTMQTSVTHADRNGCCTNASITFLLLEELQYLNFSPPYRQNMKDGGVVT